MMNNSLDYIINCPICNLIMDDPVTTICIHNFCHKCFLRIIERCPICNTILNSKDYFHNIDLKTDISRIKEIQEINKSKDLPVTKPSFIKNDENIYNENTEPKPRLKRKFTEMNSSYNLNKNSEQRLTLRTKHEFDIEGLNNAIGFYTNYKNYDIYENSSNTNSVCNEDDEMSLEFHKSRFKYS